MKTYTKEELDKILELHKKWLNGEEGGVKADLHDADLCCANLRGANLCGANLFRAFLNEVDLCGANLSNANLRLADLNEVDLNQSNLSNADLFRANLRDSILRNSYICGTDLSGADLSNADLSGAILCGADLREANLTNIGTNHLTVGMSLACPEVGSFIAWKKIAIFNSKYLVKLKIPEDAKRSSATTRKCRCSKAKVLSIVNVTIGKSVDAITNTSYCPTRYTVGEMVYPDSFDENRWNECSHGIHFFMNKSDALTY